MNSLSDRERRLVVVFGALLLILGIYLVFLRGGDDEVAIPDLFPSPSATAVIPAPPQSSPAFVIPPGARDPFGGSSGGATPAA